MDIRDFVQFEGDKSQVHHAASLSWHVEQVLTALHFIMKNLPDAMRNDFRTNQYQHSFRNNFNSQVPEFTSACNSVFYEAEALINGFNHLASENRSMQERINILEKVVMAMLDESSKETLIDFLKDSTKTGNLKIVELVDKINKISS